MDDPLIILIRDAMCHAQKLGPSPKERESNMKTAAEQVEVLLLEHHVDPYNSRLRFLVPSMTPLFTPLAFSEAFRIYDAKYRVSARFSTSISLDEVRQIMNIAQAVSSLRHNQLKLLTFDGDGTLYEDGQNYTNEALMNLMLFFLERGVCVALVTAAAYGYETDKYEKRISGFLSFLRKNRVQSDITERFMVLGGECNYLMRLNKDYHLEKVPEEEWYQYHDVANVPDFTSIKTKLLDIVEATMRKAQIDMSLKTRVLRKNFGCGIIPGGELPDCPFNNSGKARIKHETLEEIVERVRHAVSQAGITLEYCVFNGGADVWCDIGNKAIGCTILHKYLRIEPECSIHVGDQFSSTGNDLAAKKVMPILFIKSPNETQAVMKALKKQMTCLKSEFTLSTKSTLRACVQTAIDKSKGSDNELGILMNPVQDEDDSAASTASTPSLIYCNGINRISTRLYRQKPLHPEPNDSSVRKVVDIMGVNSDDAPSDQETD